MNNHPPDIQAALRVSQVQRTPCVLVLDTSGSMENHGRIHKLNEGLAQFQRSIQSRETLCQQAVLQVITFGQSPEIILDWTQGDEFVAPVVSASGLTPMGTAMRIALESTEQLRTQLRSQGIPFTRPWIFLMSDGGPNDSDWEQHASYCRAACEKGRVTIWPFAVQPDADAEALALFTSTKIPVQDIQGANFTSVFEWLCTSLGKVVDSATGQPIQVTLLSGNDQCV